MVIVKYRYLPLGSIRPPRGPPAKPKRPAILGSVNQTDAWPSGVTFHSRGLSSVMNTLPALSNTRSFHIDACQPSPLNGGGVWEKTCGAWASRSRPRRRIRPFMSATYKLWVGVGFPSSARPNNPMSELGIVAMLVVLTRLPRLSYAKTRSPSELRCPPVAVEA